MLQAITEELSEAVSVLRFGPPVAQTYNPLRYASALHLQYLQRFGQGPKEAVFLGMNPGPWGMAQTGVPFGEVAAVRDWMGLDAAVDRPPDEHPKRPVLGLDCPRSEVSGRRLWGWAAERFGSPEAFFARFFVLNYCPLSFMEASGRNRTPDKLPKVEQAPLYEACDRAFVRFVEVLEPRIIVGVGAFAQAQAKRALGELASDFRIERILHPSPASPAANRGWAPQAEAQLLAMGISLP